MPLIELLDVAQYPAFKQPVESLLRDYVNKFEQNKDQYARQNGFNNRIIAAMIAANCLEKISNDPRLKDQYRSESERYRRIQSELMESLRW